MRIRSFNGKKEDVFVQIFSAAVLSSGWPLAAVTILAQSLHRGGVAALVPV